MKKSVKNYQVIRYYPDFYIDEFINIGIVMYDNAILKVQMLSSDEISGHKKKAYHVRATLHDQMNMQLINVSSNDATIKSLEEIMEL